jgi:hypothetical protein
MHENASHIYVAEGGANLGVEAEGNRARRRAAVEVPNVDGGSGRGGGRRRSNDGGDWHRAASTTVEETGVERRHRECGTDRRGLRVLG